MELGLYTFAEVGPEMYPAQRLRNLLEEIELADQVGLDVFGAGRRTRRGRRAHEEHSPDQCGAARMGAAPARAGE